MCMEKLYAKHEVPVINVVNGINLHVKLHQVIFFFYGNQFYMSGDHFKSFWKSPKGNFQKNWAWSTEMQSLLKNSKLITDNDTGISLRFQVTQ